MNTDNIAAYLERIGYRGPLEASVETLRSLHLAHLYAVPFENLDIILGRPIALGDAELFDKIVNRRRGGFCYELNGIFSALLRGLGFRVTMLSAEVAREAGGFSPEFDHLALRVDLDKPWLVDVGFGEGFRLPLDLNDDAEQEQDGCRYRIDPINMDGEYRVLLRRDPDGWTPQFRFTLRPRSLEDFGERCRFHQTSPESHFTRGRICTLATPEGRVSLSGLRLIVTTGTERTERWLAGEAEYAAVLRQTFGVIE
jgi:N-hydroxyarylamine O-acetyltransferase